MKTLFEHIEYVKGKPHHIRKRVALAVTIVVTALIALIWAAGTLSMGGFAIQGSTFADSAEQSAVVTTVAGNANQNLAGAAAALGSGSAPAHIEIVDTSSSTRAVRQVEQTILPF
jgi:hypothetical protein